MRFRTSLLATVCLFGISIPAAAHHAAGTVPFGLTDTHGITIVPTCTIFPTDPTTGFVETDQITYATAIAPVAYTPDNGTTNTPMTATQDARLDVIYPTSGAVFTPPSTPRPLVMMIHGGGWVNYFWPNNSGTCAAQPTVDRCEILAIGHKLANYYGVAAVNVEYPLLASTGQKNAYPVPEEAVLCALRWVKANAAPGGVFGPLGVDVTRIQITGYSAGGQLGGWLWAIGHSGNAATFDNAACPYSSTSPGAPGDPTVQSAAPYYGFYKLDDFTGGTIVASHLNTSNPNNTAGQVLSRPASSYYQITPAAPPVFFSRGTVDQISPYTETYIQYQQVIGLGITSGMVQAAGIGHGFFPWTSSTDPRLLPDSCTWVQFINDQLTPSL